LINNIAL